MAQLDSLMKRHFVDYASYFILDRAIPDLRDGLKPVQRRILHTLFSVNDGRYHKVAGVIGETMKLHPHGDASIGDALVVLATKGYFIDRQGNFGNILTGHSAAAGRYIECRLTPLALETMFNEPLTEFRPSYDGRTKEPVFLPAKLPVTLMLGTEGIAVGMSTRILPHNLPELWEAQIELLEGGPIELYPDFPQGGLMDVAAWDDGRGKVEVRARLDAPDRKSIVIREIAFGTTTESLIASIEAAIQKGRVKVASIDDFTTDKVEIELTMSRGVDAQEVIPQLYAYTDCSVSVSSNLTVIDGRKPRVMTVTEVLKHATDQLKAVLKAELEYELGQLEDRMHRLTLEQIFVETQVYTRLETAKSEKALRSTTRKGMEEFRDLFVRELTDEDIQHLLELRIRRISAYDLERSRAEVDKIRRKIAEAKEKLKHLTRTTIHYVEGLIEKYADEYPRRTHITRIEAVDKKAAATQSIRLAYDRDSGFFGSQVKGDRFQLNVSEFDLILAVAADGSYRVMPPPDKMLFESRLLYCEVFDPEKGVDFALVYRDKQRIAYAKRVHIEKFIRNKEYHLIKDKAGKLDVLVPPERAGKLTIGFAPAPRQRVKQAKVDLRTLEVTGVTARGMRLAPKPVNKVKHEPGKGRAKKPAASRPAAPKRARGAGVAEKPVAKAKRPAKPRKPTGSSGSGQGSLF